MAEDELLHEELNALLNTAGAASSNAPATPPSGGKTAAEETSSAGADLRPAEKNDNAPAEDRVPEKPGAGAEAQPVQFQELPEQQVEQSPKSIDFIMDVSLQVSVELGRAKIKVKDILQMAPGSVLQLDKLAGESVDILINGKLIAYGEVVVVDENFGVKILDIVSTEQRVKNLN